MYIPSCCVISVRATINANVAVTNRIDDKCVCRLSDQGGWVWSFCLHPRVDLLVYGVYVYICVQFLQYLYSRFFLNRNHFKAVLKKQEVYSLATAHVPLPHNQVGRPCSVTYFRINQPTHGDSAILSIILGFRRKLMIAISPSIWRSPPCALAQLNTLTVIFHTLLSHSKIVAQYYNILYISHRESRLLSTIALVLYFSVSSTTFFWYSMCLKKFFFIHCTFIVWYLRHDGIYRASMQSLCSRVSIQYCIVKYTWGGRYALTVPLIYNNWKILLLIHIITEVCWDNCRQCPAKSE